MRRIGLAGITILLVAIIVSGVNYLNVRSFEWNPGDPGFLYSTLLTFGFIASIAAGLLGTVREVEEFLIAGGTACLALTLMNKLFTNLLYSWGYLDAALLLAGALMILDRFHIKRVKEKAKEPEPEQLLERLERLESEEKMAGPEKAGILEKQIYDVERMLSLAAKKKPELVKTLRVRLYRSPVVQEVVKKFINSDKKMIEPAVETGRGPTYPEFSDLKGFSEKKVKSTLDRLAESGILIRELYEKLISCPHCHQPSKVFFRNKCPKCGSHKTHINRLVEHVKCGAIFKEDEVREPDGSPLSCPKCGETIREDEDIKPVGVTFECESCRSVFSDPIRVFYCRSCSREFEMENSELLDTHSYRLNDEIRSEARETLTVLTLADTFKGAGFKVKIPGLVKGRSGVNHEFTLTCSKEDRLVAIDLAMSEEKVDMATVLPLYAKFSDIPAVTHLLLAIPSLDQRAKEFLKSNNVPYIESSEISDLKDEVEHRITSDLL